MGRKCAGTSPAAKPTARMDASAQFDEIYERFILN
jgi:hypothetical protein